MEEIYINDEYPKPISQTPAEHQGSTSSKKMHHLGVLMGLLNVLLLIGLIVLGVRSHDLTSDFSTIRDNLTESLQASNDQLDFMTEERNVLNTNLTEMSKELNRLQVLLKEKIGCPRGWTVFTGSCYLLSTKSGSWDEGREDCRNQGADLAVIENDDEQAFLSTINKNDAWIGLTDKETEGLWQWVDGSPLHLQYWLENQPDNGGSRLQRWGEEDCAHTSNPKAFWNDLSCSASKMWICEKLVA